MIALKRIEVASSRMRDLYMTAVMKAILIDSNYYGNIARIAKHLAKQYNILQYIENKQCPYCLKTFKKRYTLYLHLNRRKTCAYAFYLDVQSIADEIISIRLKDVRALEYAAKQVSSDGL